MPRKTNNNRAKQQNNRAKTKSNRQSPTVNVRVQAAPVARGNTIIRRSSPQIRNSGKSIIVRNHSLIPINKANSTGDHITSVNLKVADSSIFPFLATQATVYDKCKWRKCSFSFISALPTTAGGTASMYMDSDTLDTAAANTAAAMQNESCKVNPIWKNSTYVASKKFLRTSEMFTTAISTAGSLSDPPNTFSSPARFHVITSPLTGVSFTTTTLVGHLLINYEVELLHPSQAASTVPARVQREVVEEDNLFTFDGFLVNVYENFVAGAVRPVTFWRFLTALQRGNMMRLIQYCQVDQESLDFLRFAVPKTTERPLSVLDLVPFSQPAHGRQFSEGVSDNEESDTLVDYDDRYSHQVC